MEKKSKSIRCIGFDNVKYAKAQEKAILERIKKFKGKLYLEFGGKLFDDYHFARCVPGFNPRVKLEILKRIKNKLEVIICVSAEAIEKGKIRGDYGITYETNILKIIDELDKENIEICAVVITKYDMYPSAKRLKDKLKRQNIKVYTHKSISEYPNNIDLIVSDKGYGKNPYIKTSKPLIVVTAPGGSSGKLATCLSQIYHEYKRGKNSGYAKFETIPVWNLPLKHAVNVAYEASTADIQDINMIDPFHLEAYQKEAINYNRDIEAFPILKRILDKIMKNGCPYKSPTEMGVNEVKKGIINEDCVIKASKEEIIRRYFRYECEYVKGSTSKKTLERMKELMLEADVVPEDRKVVLPARRAAKEAVEKGKGHKGIFCGGAIELDNGEIVTGKNSPIMHASSSLILNAIKVLANIPDELDLLSLIIIKSIERFKRDILNSESLSLNLTETLIALSISATTNPTAKLAMERLKELENCEMHLTHIPTPGDEAGLKKLGVNLTCDPVFSSKNLYED